jgi:hypothetical protein
MPIAQITPVPMHLSDPSRQPNTCSKQAFTIKLATSEVSEVLPICVQPQDALDLLIFIVADYPCDDCNSLVVERWV